MTAIAPVKECILMVDSKSEELSKGTGKLSGKNVRPLSSMTNIERQEWGINFSR